MMLKLKIIKALFPILIILIAIASLLILIMFVIPRYNNAPEDGIAIGESKGMVVGTVKGSINGSFDYWAGRNEGNAQGISADDTKVTDITSIIQGTGNLQVLVAGVEFDIPHEIGDKYAAIYLLRGEATFTVNLGEAIIDENQNTVMIPQPKPTLNYDETEVKKIAEWQTKFFDGRTEEGYTAYMNSIEQSKKNISESIANYDELLTMAKEAAKEQVQMLAKNMTGKTVTVTFLPGGEE